MIANYFKLARSLSLVCLICLGTNGFSDEAKPIKRLPKSFEFVLEDVQGNVHQPFEGKSNHAKAVALVFVTTDCPIANAFQPELQGIATEYDEQGIPFFLIYCSRRMTEKRLKQHAVDYEIAIPQILDADQKLGKLVGAKVTPEAIVIDDEGRVQYRGKINNLYEGFGKKRAKPTEHYLRDVCDAITAGKAVSTSNTQPIGCFIQYQGTKQK